MQAALILSACAFPVQASDEVFYMAEMKSTLSSGNNTPFWFVSNQQGLGSPRRNYGYVRAAAIKDLDEDRRFSWGAGIDLVGSWRSEAPFLIHQLYGELKYRCLGLMVGSKEMWCSHNDPYLSSGSLLYSGNALPVPQVRMGIFDYTPFWGTRGWFCVKGYLSYGMFTDSKWQKSWVQADAKRAENVLFHSKGLWIRGGNTEIFPLTADVGIEMATQFGGTVLENGKRVHIKTGLKEWLKALFPTYSNQEGLLGSVASIEGNMLGQYTIGLEWQPDADWSARGYFEHYFEDQSMMTFEYGWKDALWGVEIQLPENPVVSRFVYEYLYSKDQAGAVNNDSKDLVPEQVSGRDNYYNHSSYPGWQHWGMGIGNPLMLSPVFNADHLPDFRTTRIIAHHFGIEGNPSATVDYRLLLSFSRNWGTYTKPYPDVLGNFNALAEVSWYPAKLKGWYGRLGVAIDSGNLLGRNSGIAVTIGKAGWLNF